jgi:CubicO group peptidase (beta-lactamase class C family)
VIVRKDDQVILEEYGAGKHEGTVDAESLWPLYSVTKSVAVGAILALENKGTVSLDDPVSKYLGAFKTKGDGEGDRRDVTIRHLASNTGGVSISREKYVPAQDKPPDMAFVQVDTPPGEVFEYSALGVHILQNTIEAATGEPFEKTLSVLVFEPLGLSSARYLAAHNSELPIIPVRKAEKVADRYYYAQNGLACNSGIYMTATDLNRYGQVWLDSGQPGLFSEQLRDQAWKNYSRPDEGIGYGLMWWTIEDSGGYVMAGWGGQVTAVVPKVGVVLTVLRNSYDHPNHGPSFKYSDDKKHLVELCRRLGSASK